MAKSSGKAGRNNKANQMNPNNSAYAASRRGSGASKAARDNRANQMNPNHDASKPGAKDGTGGANGGSAK